MRYVSYIATVLNYRYISSYVMLGTHSIQGYFSAPIQHNIFYQISFGMCISYASWVGGKIILSDRRKVERVNAALSPHDRINFLPFLQFLTGGAHGGAKQE